MGGLGDAIRYLYEKFILRDVLSFVTPGAIIVFTALFLFCPELLSRPMHWLLYIPLFGVFYMVGFAIQCLGEFFGIIRFTPQGLSTWGDRLKIFWFNWVKPAKAWWWKEDDENIVNFHEKMENNKDKSEWAGQWRERRIVTKQMCANGSIAIFLALLLIPISLGKSPLFLLIIGIPLLISLFWGYRVLVLRQDTITNTILHKTTTVNEEEVKER